MKMNAVGGVVYKHILADAGYEVFCYHDGGSDPTTHDFSFKQEISSNLQ